MRLRPGPADDAPSRATARTRSRAPRSSSRAASTTSPRTSYTPSSRACPTRRRVPRASRSSSCPSASSTTTVPSAISTAWRPRASSTRWMPRPLHLPLEFDGAQGWMIGEPHKGGSLADPNPPTADGQHPHPAPPPPYRAQPHVHVINTSRVGTAVQGVALREGLPAHYGTAKASMRALSGKGSPRRWRTRLFGSRRCGRCCSRRRRWPRAGAQWSTSARCAIPRNSLRNSVAARL